MHILNDNTNQVIELHKQYLEKMIIGNVSLYDEYLFNNISDLNCSLFQKLTDAEANLNYNISQFQLQTKNDISDVQTTIDNNKIIVENKITQMNFNVQQLQNDQQKLQLDLALYNQTLSDKMKNLQIQANQIDAEIISLVSQTSNQYNQQETQLSILDLNLVQNISDLNTTIQGQIHVLNQADSMIQNSLSALQTQYSSYSAASTLNNTNQQTQINSLQSTVSAHQTQLSQITSDISQVNTTSTGQLNMLQITTNPLSNRINSIDSDYSTQYNNQQLTLQTLIAINNNLNQYFTQIQASFNNVVSTTNTQLQDEIQARINGDQNLQTQLNIILSDMLSNKNYYLTTNSSLSSFVNNQLTTVNQIYATKEEIQQYLCLKQPSHAYVGGVCILVCGYGATLQAGVCVCTNSSLIYRDGICQLSCGVGAAIQSGICICTDQNYQYFQGKCELLSCGAGATVQAGKCVCTNLNLTYSSGICQLICATGATVQSGVCVCGNPSYTYKYFWVSGLRQQQCIDLSVFDICSSTGVTCE
ncbi:Conserved_hypothetical protein [Hexamita inflata]|uniref:Uncharacterized protein n=1 Tax=Hexamita inflata TaxID=28002 RepID=A0AA86QD89_9EUKA|nr:Conserved hypothetical protein [Hexamita inflata]CAI9950901.1 Conserved hypothetical protein [Hexamita inflata]